MSFELNQFCLWKVILVSQFKRMNDWLTWLGGTLESGHRRGWKWQENENGVLVGSFDIWEEAPTSLWHILPVPRLHSLHLDFYTSQLSPHPATKPAFAPSQFPPCTLSREKIFRHVTLILAKLHFFPFILIPSGGKSPKQLLFWNSIWFKKLQYSVLKPFLDDPKWIQRMRGCWNPCVRYCVRACITNFSR